MTEENKDNPQEPEQIDANGEEDEPETIETEEIPEESDDQPIEDESDKKEPVKEEEIDSKPESETMIKPESDTESTDKKFKFDEFSEKTKKKLEKERIKAEEKSKKKEIKRKKRKEDRGNVEKGFRKVLHDQFHGILDEDKIIYTIVFFVGALVISIFSLFGTGWPLMATEITALIFFFGFIILMLFALSESFRTYMFGPVEEWLHKLIFILIAFVIGTILTLVIIFNTEAGDVSIVFLQHDQLIPAIFVVIFIGWNVIQIHFIKDGFEEISVQAEEKLYSNSASEDKKRNFSILFLVIGLVFPLLIHALTIWGFYAPFKALNDQDAFNIYIGWAVIMGLIVIVTDIWQIKLFIHSKNFGAPNVFSNMFYMLLWVIFWFRSFGFINAFLSETTSGSDIFVIIGNVLLLAFTSIMVLRGLADRVKKTNLLNEDSIPFLVYALTILYVAGQVAMILNGFGTRNQVNLFNNAIIMVTSFGYYFWYSKYVLERRGYIPRNLMTANEVSSILIEYSDVLKIRVPESEDEIDYNLKQISKKYRLQVEKITEAPKDTAETKDTVETKPVQEEEELDPESTIEDTTVPSEPKKIEFESEEDITLDVNEEIEEKAADSDVEFDEEADLEKELDEEIKDKTETEE